MYIPPSQTPSDYPREIRQSFPVLATLSLGCSSRLVPEQ